MENLSTVDPGVFLLATRARRLQICWNTSSKVAVGNGRLTQNHFQRIMLGFLVEGHI